MRTVVTFAELRRAEPLVLGSSSSRFYLLFSLNHDEVLLRNQWDPDVDRADYVLTIERHPQRSSTWYLYTHEESPLPRTKGAFQCCRLPGRRWHIPSEKDEIRVEAGRLVSFGFHPKWLEHEVQMMLTNEVSPQGVSADSAPLPTNTLFKKMPAEDLRSIFSYLPTSTLVRVLSFVSQGFFDILRSDIVSWEVLDFRKDVFCLEDLRALCPLAAESCKELYLMDVHSNCLPWTMADDRLKEIHHYILLECRWPSVRKLHVGGTMYKLNKAWVKEALSSGNFPALETLIWSQRNWSRLFEATSRSSAFRELQGAQIANLKRLVFDVEGEFKNGVRGTDIWKVCSGLETLHLRFSGELWMGLLKGRDGSCPLKELVELKIMAPFALSTLRRELSSLAGSKLRRLMIGGKNVWGNDDSSESDYSDEDDSLYADGPQGGVVENFPHLETLCLRGELGKQHGNIVSGAVFQNLKVFRGKLHKSVPFEKMINLEGLWLDVFLREVRDYYDPDLDDDNTGRLPDSAPQRYQEWLKQFRSTLQTILTQPNLEALVLEGFSIPDVLNGHLPKFCNTSVMHVEFHCRRIDEKSCGGFKKLLACLPNVQRLKVVGEEGTMAPKSLASVVKVRGKNVVELVVSIIPKRHQKGFYERQIESVLEGLPEEWTVMRKFEGYGREVATFRRGHVLRAPDKCYLFEDVFFDVDELA